MSTMWGSLRWIAVAALVSALAPTVSIAQATDELSKGMAAIQRDDYDEAARLFRVAADQGNARAQAVLGALYQNGQGVPRLPVEAVRLYRLAAEQGDRVGQSLLGRAYMNGVGVSPDKGEYIKWFRLAAAQGDVTAQFELGTSSSVDKQCADKRFRCDLSGFEKLVKPDEALRWLRLAAEQGHSRAQIKLGKVYFEGRAVPQDYIEGYKWINIVAINGDLGPQIDATDALENLVPLMTAAQLEEGEKRSRAWRPGTSNR